MEGVNTTNEHTPARVLEVDVTNITAASMDMAGSGESAEAAKMQFLWTQVGAEIRKVNPEWSDSDEGRNAVVTSGERGLGLAKQYLEQYTGKELNVTGLN